MFDVYHFRDKSVMTYILHLHNASMH